MCEQDYTTPPIGYDHPVTRELCDRYGTLITLAQLANIFQRPERSLRQTIADQRGQPWTTLRSGRRDVGRHVHIDARYVAAVIAGYT